MDSERFIEELMIDRSHPVYNRAHPLHNHSAKAPDEMRQRLEAMLNEWLSNG